MNIIVLALNPSVDVEWRVEDVRWEEKNSIQQERRWPGGKGVNVARWARFLKGKANLLLPLGGTTGQELARGLRKEKIPFKSIPLREPTRANIIVTTKIGRQLRFNPAGPELIHREWNAIRHLLKQMLASGSLLVLSGSLPRGLKPDVYTELIRLARGSGAKSLLDADGMALQLAVKAQPFLVKPNQHELSEWAGKRLSSVNDIRSAAEELSRRTRGWIFVSMGKNGGILTNKSENFFAKIPAPKVKVVNTVGAGDAALAAAACAIANGDQPEEWLRKGVETGTLAAQCAAGELP